MTYEQETTTGKVNMMADQNDGGPAFPRTDVDEKGRMAFFPGMSLRDWFAGQALAGLISHPENNCTVESDAEVAYRTADAMLAEREDRGTE